MKEDKDRLMEGLWMLYEAEGVLWNISIGQFFMENNVNYNEFYKWYKSMYQGVYQLQMRADLALKKSCMESSHRKVAL